MASEDVEQSQSGMEDAGGPGAPTSLHALEVSICSTTVGVHSWMAAYHNQGVAGLTKRDIQLIIDGGYNTVESVAYTPRRVLEQIKGISEQKATKILTEGMCIIATG